METQHNLIGDSGSTLCALVMFFLVSGVLLDPEHVIEARLAAMAGPMHVGLVLVKDNVAI